MIELTGLTKRYGSQAVVDGVSGTIEAGGVVSIIGANGAGKSTLLSMAARLLPMDEGTVFVDELDILATPSDQLARKLSILRQENALSVRLSVRDLVAFGRHPHNKGRHTAASTWTGRCATSSSRSSPTGTWTSSPAASGNGRSSPWSSPRTPTTSCSTSP